MPVPERTPKTTSVNVLGAWRPTLQRPGYIADRIIQLQHAIGNRAVQRLLRANAPAQMAGDTIVLTKNWRGPWSPRGPSSSAQRITHFVQKSRQAAGTIQ